MEIEQAHAAAGSLAAARADLIMISQDGAQLVEELERRYLERSTDLNTLLTVQRRVLQARRDGLDLALQEMLVRQWLGDAMGTLGQ